MCQFSAVQGRVFACPWSVNLQARKTSCFLTSVQLHNYNGWNRFLLALCSHMMHYMTKLLIPKSTWVVWVMWSLNPGAEKKVEGKGETLQILVGWTIIPAEAWARIKAQRPPGDFKEEPCALIHESCWWNGPTPLVGPIVLNCGFKTITLEFVALLDIQTHSFQNSWFQYWILFHRNMSFPILFEHQSLCLFFCSCCSQRLSC